MNTPTPSFHVSGSGWQNGHTRSQSQASGVYTADDIELMAEKIHDLQDQLSHCLTEKQRVADQLTCVIQVVRKAWSGDKEAAIHVASIVGAAPPEMSEEDEEGRIVLTAKPKSQAVNNWAKLCMGLLNRVWRQGERVLEHRQTSFLHGRVDYLEDQLSFHNDVMANKPRYRAGSFGSHDASSSATVPRGSSASRARALGSRVPPRPMSGKAEGEGAARPRVRLADLIVNPSASPALRDQQLGFLRRSQSQESLQQASPAAGPQHHAPTRGHSHTASAASHTANGASHTANGASHTANGASHATSAMRYDDPRRYSQGDTFNPERVLGTDQMRRHRPVSGKTLKPGDNIRSRPKSGVFLTQRVERPLKYETTRPISSKPKINSRPPSGKPRAASAQPCATSASQKRQAGGAASGEQKKSSAGKERKIPDCLKPPESVTQFVDALQEEKSLEDGFKRDVAALQKKLGIDGGGLISWYD